MKGSSRSGPIGAGVLLSCAISLLMPELQAQGSPPLPPPPPPPPAASAPAPPASPTGLSPLPPPPPPPSAERAAPPPSGSAPYGWGYPPPWVYPPGNTAAPSPYAPPPPPESKKVQRWYGWQIYLVDGGWLLGALLLSGSNSTEKSAGDLAAAGYLLGAPIVHWAHGNVGRGFGSAGLRLGGPIAGFAAGFGLGAVVTQDDWGRIGFGALGAVGGFVAAIVIDAQVLAREEVDEAPQTSKLTVVPSLSLGNGGGSLGLLGAF